MLIRKSVSTFDINKSSSRSNISGYDEQDDVEKKKKSIGLKLKSSYSKFIRLNMHDYYKQPLLN